jgi:L-amino acid N-acyltransferase YncA
MKTGDWPDVARIYADGLATGVATFETEVPSYDDWSRRHLPTPRLVAELDGVVAGWVAATKVSSRPCYAGVVEHSVYVDPGRQGRGAGRALLEAFVAEASSHGIWTIQTAIMAGNVPSLALHRGCGFREVGRRERIGERDGIWHDTILLELRL